MNGQPACYGNSPGHGTEDGRTVVRVAMHQITRPEIAKKLWELDDAGCYVDIVYRYLDVEGAGTAIADQLSKPTRFGGIALHRLDDADDGDGDPTTRNATATHSKYLLIDGTYLGNADQKIVFTGSHPYTKSALTTNDEALLKYDDAAVHDAYRENFRAQRALADQQVARVGSPADPRPHRGDQRDARIRLGADPVGASRWTVPGVADGEEVPHRHSPCWSRIFIRLRLRF